ncbi:MAG: glycosyltransferase family 1 protein [Prolixibacteraceae bacterium]
MRIGYDAKRAVQNNTGLGNYSRHIIETLSGYYPETSLLLFSPKKKENPRLDVLKSRKNVRFIFPSGIWRLLSSFWRISAIKPDLKKHSIDIFHGLSNELPFGTKKTGIKSVVTIHDLIFLRYPGLYKPLDRMIYRLKFSYACRNADKIIAVSECTKRDIVSFFNIPSEKVEVVYQGCHPDFLKPVAQEKKNRVRGKYQLADKFILYVGSIEPRKNLMLAVRSLSEINRHVRLVAIGKRTSYQTSVEEFVGKNGLSDRVKILNRISFEELPSFYQLASVFVYPSFFEGFGIPVIEALSSGLPVIAATGSCLEEAGGEHSLYIDPHDHQALAKQINKVLNDPDLAAAMAEKGKQYVQRFSAHHTAKELSRIYKEVLSF